MKFLVDEHIPLITVRALRGMGHEVLDIRGTADEGMSDGKLWELAQREERILVTTDKGFSQFRRVSHFGIIIVRLHHPNRHNIHARIMSAIGQFAEKDWPGTLLTMRDVAQSVSRNRIIE